MTRIWPQFQTSKTFDNIHCITSNNKKFVQFICAVNCTNISL